jgi:NAD(P)-dependent dehydrogenase (short-subunit alcohol dehydrogenase family)
VVTGGGQGIGRAISLAFAAKGASIVLAELDAEAGPECAALVERAGGEAVFHQTDVAREESVRELFQVCADRYGRLDVLVNNAGIGGSFPLAETTVDQWDHVLAVNLRGPYLCVKYALPLLREAGGGAVINIASTRALMSEPNTEPYSASKGGLLALTHALAVSLGPAVRVNAISPGWIETSAWQKASRRKEPELREIDHAQHPVGRVGRPEDVAAACVFLASPEAGFITGTNLVVDGGMTVRMIYEEC